MPPAAKHGSDDPETERRPRSPRDGFLTCLGSQGQNRAEWWSGEDKFQKKHATILRFDGAYYYFVLAKEGKSVALQHGTDAEALTVKRMGMVGQNLPKFLFAFGVNPYFEEHPEAEECILTNRVSHPVRIRRQVYEIKKSGLFTKEAAVQGLISEEERLENLHLMIDAYRAFMEAFVQFEKYDFTGLLPTEEYRDFGEFIADVETHTARMEWKGISLEQLRSLVAAGDAYLFKIYDRFLYSTAPERNIQTRLFLTMLSDRNLERTDILLNTNPLLSYRPASGRPEQPSANDSESQVGDSMRSTATGPTEPASAGSIDSPSEGKQINSRHQEAFFLKLTITINADVSERKRDSLNQRINDAISDGTAIVSVSRSTEDLLYALVMDEKGQVLEELSLNSIDDTDYLEKLSPSGRSGRKSPGKTGYLRLAVSKILRLAYRYQAVIVLEDFRRDAPDWYYPLSNAGFLEFREILCQRLNNLTFPEIPEGEPGSVSNPMQLTDKKGSHYQNGIVSFVGDLYTKNIDPETGFADIFLRDQEKRRLLSRMDQILFDGDRFLLTFDYAKYHTRYKPSRTRWSVEISGSMVYYDRKKHRSTISRDIVTVLLNSAASFELKGNLSGRISSAPEGFVDTLWSAFFGTLHGNRKGPGEKRGVYVSPVNKKEYGIGTVNAFNLAKKYCFRRNYQGTSTEFTKSWLDYIQKG